MNSLGTTLIFTLLDVDICCTHKYLNSMRHVLSKRAIALASLEAVHVPNLDRHHQIRPQRLPTASAVSVTAKHSDSASLKARVACVFDQCFTTIPLIIITLSSSISSQGLSPSPNRRERRSSINSSSSNARISHITFVTPSNMSPNFPACASPSWYTPLSTRLAHRTCP